MIGSSTCGQRNSRVGFSEELQADSAFERVFFLVLDPICLYITPKPSTIASIFLSIIFKKPYITPGFL